MERAAHYDGGAAEGCQQDLDAAQGELESFLPSIQGIVEEGLIGEFCAKLKAQLERTERAMNALMGIQGAGVLEAMGIVARRNAAWNWRIAKGRLARTKWCCKNQPPKVPADVAPPPAEPRTFFWNLVAFRKEGKQAAKAPAWIGPLTVHPDAFVRFEALFILREQAPEAPVTASALTKARRDKLPEIKAWATQLPAAPGRR